MTAFEQKAEEQKQPCRYPDQDGNACQNQQHRHLSLIHILVGSASAYNDADKSMVLSVANENDSRANYLKLPSDTFQGITEGFSIGMWVKTTGSTSVSYTHLDRLRQSALYGLF